MVHEDMDKLGRWGAQLTILDRKIEPVATRRVDISQPGWAEHLGERPRALDETGTRAEVEALLEEIIDEYPSLKDSERISVRKLFRKCPHVTWAVESPQDDDPSLRFRKQLILFSIKDMSSDTRDAILELQHIATTAVRAGIDIYPLLMEAAEWSSDENIFGMGSTRRLLEAQAQRAKIVH
ncbi:MAG: hypothetical protein U0136_10570 [Bdellovibrionota bacterium]